MVRVSIIQDVEKYLVRVGVESKKKPGLWANRDVDPGNASGEAQLKKLVAASAYLCAGYLCEKYEDTIDLTHIGGEAVREFGKECMLIALLQSGIPAKVSRLKKLDLSDKNAEILDRINFNLSRGNVITQLDSDWIDHTLRNELKK